MKSLYVLFKPKPSSPAKISFPTVHRSSPDESHFIPLIHSCKDIASLRRVYAQILRRSLLTSRVASQLLSCSSLLKSPDYTLSIFRYSKEKNLFVFNALIRGLTENARFECSLRHFIMMLRLGVRPDRLTFPFVLKSNSKLGFRWLGKALHAATVKDCVDCDSFVRVSLVDMYGKTKGLKYAYQVFDESPERIKKEGVLLWNVLINGYCRAKDMQTAATLFGSMPERNSGSWSTLIKGYVNSGELNRAKQCFELMPEKNVVSLTTLINGFSQNDEYETAISIYFEMVEKGMKPNEYTVAAVLSACSKSGALESGIRVHGYVLDNGFKLDRAIGTALVDMYAKCGEVDCAANVFSNMGDKDILSWTAMIQGWAVHGRFQQAILCFREMMYSGEKPDEVVFLAVLTACLNSGEVDLGINFFDSMRLDYAIEPTLKHYVVVVDLLGRAGKLNEAHELIESMPIKPDLTTWAALYRACKAHNSNRKGEMVSQNLVEIDPELRGSYIFLAEAKGKHQDVEKRRLPLQKMVKERCKGWSYIEVDGQLNKFVAGDDSHKQAQEIRLKLEEIVSLAVERGYIPGDTRKKNLFVFNALIRGLTENARFECSLRHFIMMLRLGVRPDRLTFPFVLKSNSKLGFRWLGKALHAATVKDCVDCDSFVRVSLVDMYGYANGCNAFRVHAERNSGSWSTLIKGYVNSGELNRAKQCFELMPEKNVVSLTTLINGFSQNDEYETAISIYFEMVEKGMKPNEYTVAAVLSACSKSGALESGIRVHGYVLDNGLGGPWAVSTGYPLFQRNDVFRRKPDEVVFLAVLTACLNSGEVDLGINFFDSMRLDYAIEPTLKHYVVVVDLLGRAGKLSEAHELIESMPIKPDLTAWAALYRACKAQQ
ncbi:hypothetical protein Bca52824_061904 [Brassica carinata]|uniref:Pentatricopeptide repeat-containing protein n=1 Tax=Brassica carinata TaxID=52824 RepID=A0A8X7QBP7_BRACI|nr:hypothetical protein Bca52824_061904 [Brassica carinata]